MIRRHPTLFLFLLLIVSLGTWFFAQLFWPAPPIAVSTETTWLTEPLADDGLPDYAAYLLAKGREGVTVENNGAIPFLQAMWPAELDSSHQGPLCKELGMEIPTQPGMGDPEYDQQLLDRLVEQLQREQPEGAELDEESSLQEDLTFDERAQDLIEYTQTQPWTREQLPALAEWIDNHARHYELLHEAARRPKFYAPSPTLLSDPKESLVMVMLPVLGSMREGARALSRRAMLHLGEGNIEAAWDDCRPMHGLARHTDRTWIVSDLVSIAMEMIADKVTLRILESRELTPEIAREILDLYRQRPPRSSMANSLDEGERLMYITSLLAFSGDRVSAAGSDLLETPELEGLRHFGLDWNVMLSEGNQWYDRIVEAMHLPTWKEREDAFTLLEEEMNSLIPTPGGIATALFSRQARAKEMSNVFLALLLPAISAASGAEDRANSYTQLHTVAAALAVYRVEHGEYPDALDELVPDLLDAVPVDLFHQNPLVYRRTDDGYLLYSLGANGTDEGGSNDTVTVYEGYSVSDDAQEQAAREALGLPPLRDPDLTENLEELDEETDEATVPLGEQIPAGADDWSLRLPLPRVAFPSFD